MFAAKLISSVTGKQRFCCLLGEGKRRTMLLGRIALPVFTALVLVGGSVSAETLHPLEGKTIQLGTIGGIVYYTIQPDGYRVVVTLGTDSPMRFIATLSPEQSIFLSTPRGPGEPAIQMHLLRRGEQLLVEDTE